MNFSVTGQRFDGYFAARTRIFTLTDPLADTLQAVDVRTAVERALFRDFVHADGAQVLGFGDLFARHALDA